MAYLPGRWRRRLCALISHCSDNDHWLRPASSAERQNLPATAAEDSVAGVQDYAALERLFVEFRREMFGSPKEKGYDFSAAAMEGEFDQLRQFQSRLLEFHPEGWPVEQQVDYHLVRAEMNGLEFQHRVLKPWAKDPGHYSELVERLGISCKKGQIETAGSLPPLPLSDEDYKEITDGLTLVRPILEDGRRNLSVDLSAVSVDMATLAIFMIGDGQLSYAALAKALEPYHPELAGQAEDALAALGEYVAWLEDSKPQMRAKPGVGKENYNWLMREVYLFPYTWEEIKLIVELEDNRVCTFQRLEANRNQHVEGISDLQPVQSALEYKDSVAEAITSVLAFIEEQEIMTLDGLPTFVRKPFNAGTISIKPTGPSSEPS